MALRNSNMGRSGGLLPTGGFGGGLDELMAKTQAAGANAYNGILQQALAVAQRSAQAGKQEQPSLLDTMGLEGSDAFRARADATRHQNNAAEQMLRPTAPPQNPFQDSFRQQGSGLGDPAQAMAQPKPQGAFGQAQQTDQRNSVGAFGGPQTNPEQAIAAQIANPSSPATTNPVDRQIFGAFDQGLRDAGVDAGTANKAIYAGAFDPVKDQETLQGLSQGLQNIGVPQNIADLVKNPDGAIAAANDAFSGKLDIASQMASNPIGLEQLRLNDPELYEQLMRVTRGGAF